jgi:mRNA-degrading endonuclease RelE of RelBE toxin-antitoxin system
MIAVVETEEFLADVKGVLSEDEHDALILYVAQYPEAGDLITETGGLRKLRWASKGKGKRAGSRVIYYFHNMDIPLFLMAIYAKNVQTDLSMKQRKVLTAQLRALKRDWRRKRNEADDPAESRDRIPVGSQIAPKRATGARLGEW